MKLCRLLILAFIVTFSVTVAAEPIATMIQWSHEFGSRPATRASMRLISTDFDGPPGLGVALPLYSSNTSSPDWYRMHNAENRRPFCERSPNGCLAFGILLGVGIVYFLVEAQDDVDGDTRVSFTSGSTGVTVNDTR
jgi:hypothetical protein